MKKIICLLCVVAFMAAMLTGCGTPAPTATPAADPTAAPSTVPTPEQTAEPTPEGMEPGDYSATVKGFYGDFEVTVTVDETSITAVTAGENNESTHVGAPAMELMAANMVEHNTALVDVITGATATTAAFRLAVVECVTAAGAPLDLTAPPAIESGLSETISTDVLVIGGGGAGLAAAVTAASNGANVTLIEKQGILGGNTLISAGIVYGPVDEADIPGMVDYYMNRAEGDASRDMLTYYAENALDTIAFLEDAGAVFTMSVPAGTAPEARARFSEGFSGASIINALTSRALELGVTILTNVEGKELLVADDGSIIGAKAASKYCEYTIECDAVILATGGFDASEVLKKIYAESSENDYPLSNKGNTGDGIIMGKAVGADTLFKGGMIGFICVDAHLSNSGLSGAAMGSAGFAKQDGTFLAKYVDYPIAHTAIKASGEEFVYGLYGAGGENGLAAAIGLGLAFSGETVEELAEATGMDAENLAASIEELALEAPYFAVIVRPTTIGSMGGLKINTNAEVLAVDGSPIPGLYAAGEVANGDFYKVEYPASGSSNSISMTYGRAAGEGAVEYIAAKTEG